MRIGTWALDIFLKSNYIEWIARSNRLPDFLTPRTQLPLVIAGPRSAKAAADRLSARPRRRAVPQRVSLFSEFLTIDHQG